MSRAQQQPGAVCGVSCCSPCRCTTTCIFVPAQCVVACCSPYLPKLAVTLLIISMTAGLLMWLCMQPHKRCQAGRHRRRLRSPQHTSGRTVEHPRDLAIACPPRTPSGEGRPCTLPAPGSTAANQTPSPPAMATTTTTATTTTARRWVAPATPRTTCHWRGEAWGRHQAPR